MIRSAAALALGLVSLQAASGVPRDARSLLHPLVRGAHAVGFRVLALSDPSRPARPIGAQLWYPASGCDRAMTFADYFGADPPSDREPGMRARRLADARARLADAVGPIQDETWEAFAELRMAACADTPIAPGPHPVIVGRFNSGAWPLQAEYLASHGYAVLLVASRGARLQGTREDWPRQIAVTLRDQVQDMEVALKHLPSLGAFDVARLGVFGAGDASMPFAMQSSKADAVVLQDSNIFGSGLGSDAARLMPTWRPAELRAAVMQLHRDDSAAADTRLDDLRAMRHVPRLRVVLKGVSASHEDLSAAGHALRRLNGTTDPVAVGHMRAFEAGLAAARTFFDAYVRQDSAARARVEARGFVDSAAGRVEWLPPASRTPAKNEPRATAADDRTRPLLSPGHLLYDEGRGRLVMVGAYELASVPEQTLVWEWTRTEWTTRPATSGPPMRTLSGAAYDSRRKRIVLFGGIGSNGLADPRGDTWEWDGRAWAQIPDTSIGNRDHHAMAYDERRARTVVFGGVSSVGGPTATREAQTATWEWDGNSWTRVATSGPPPRASTAIAYDRTRKRIVLFGGVSVGSGTASRYGDTWTWDGRNWRHVSDAGPAARNGHAMAFERRSGNVVLFGGAAGATHFDDMWMWDGARWREIVVSGDKPSRRVGATMTYDSGRDRLILFGGLTREGGQVKTSNELWEWNGQRWTRIQ